MPAPASTVALGVSLILTLSLALGAATPACTYRGQLHVTQMCTTLPLLKIDTFGVPLSPTWPNPKVAASVSLAGVAESGVVDFHHPGSAYDGSGSIKVRGQTSRANPKKSYTLDIGKSTELLGMPKSKKWVLYAPWGDKSLLRNVLSYAATAAQGPWAPRTRLVELFLNTTNSYSYEGVYVLTEKIRVAADRVDITKLTPDDNSLPAVSGGYIVKKDKLHDGEVAPFTIHLPSSIELYPAAPKGEDLTPAQKSYIADYMTAWESAFNTSLAVRAARVSTFANLTSFADYFLSTELFHNQDGFRHSVYMYKDRSGLLHAGPQWDLDVTYANVFNDGSAAGWQYKAWPDVPFWWAALLETHDFAELVKDRWSALRRGPWSDGALDLLAAAVAKPLGLAPHATANATERNFAVWPILNLWKWPELKSPLYSFWQPYYDVGVRDWLHARLAWMDRAVADLFLWISVTSYFLMLRLFTSTASAGLGLRMATAVGAMAPARLAHVLYSKDHEWIRVEDETATVGITDFAQDALGEIVYVELPDVGDEFDEGETFAVVDSTKAASDVYAPITGSVVSVNETLEEDPGLVNSAAESDGWMVQLAIAKPDELESLMDADAYAAFCAESK
ncbi:uncharacterized protein AMSG_11867 [Thecamonas trahens ATCC 50062]|uniref:Lipoyl-binding domain-containing protein n=1 Tax=Thecamonas trahens ATCC 50062 TaxID=461836 RepID=A0A0L0DD39_THETB|nr:hypothetical protein AMSG_11867 [Thecamonas trahens ATCC 50062]KNC49243.1 hypothetical protein AMSG_11867 [Thecamonas trahens ATCC 50062]|eukprot:XP_013758065.1 hypothetical protein AMSG_11867 [Thecamonas trahens ATCC 50062]